MRNFFNRYRYPIAASAIGIGLGVIWLVTQPSSPSAPARALLVGQKHDIQTVLGQRGYKPMACPAAATTCWSASMNELSGAIQLKKNDGTYSTMAPTGTPLYQQKTNIPASGANRKGWYFERAATEYVGANATNVLEIGTGSNWSTEGIWTYDGFTNYTIIDTGANGGTSGFHMGGQAGATATFDCMIHNGVGLYIRSFDTGWAFTPDSPLRKPHYYACTWERSGGNWAAKAYIDGVEVAAAAGGPVAGDITNSKKPTIGGYTETNPYFTGSIYELRVSNVTRSAAEILTNYRNLIENGTYLTTDASTIAHYKFNEADHYSGLVDSSTSANTLYGQTFQSSYAGPFSTYTTDLADDWAMSTGTNLYLGMDSAGANLLNGLLVDMTIYPTR